MKKLYRFSEGGYRGGSVEGLFVADESEVAAIIGKTAHFGEILGKHSDVSIKLEPAHFMIVTDDADFIAKFRNFGCESGQNPIITIAEYGI